MVDRGLDSNFKFQQRGCILASAQRSRFCLNLFKMGMPIAVLGVEIKFIASCNKNKHSAFQGSEVYNLGTTHHELHMNRAERAADKKI
jgi:hypothetical protein